jgi:hypothetical protein
MINSREYQFLVELFSRPEYSIINSKIKELYGDNFHLFFEDFLSEIFSIDSKTDSLITKELFEELKGFQMVVENEFVPFLVDNYELKVVSDFFQLIIENELIKNEVNERSNFIEGFKLIERNSLKKRFQKIDEEDGLLSENEIRKGIQFVEREAFREKFNSIDQEEKTTSNSYLSIWNISKYAAILLICIIPFYYYFQKDTTKHQLAKKTKSTQPIKKITDSTKEPIVDFDLTIDSYLSQSVVVITESNQAFVKETQTTKLLLHILNDAKAIEVIHRLKQLKPTTNKIIGTIDSLNQIINKYQNTYTFDIQKCELYINQHFESVNKSDFKILNIQIDEQKKYFLKVKEVYFELCDTKNPRHMVVENDEEVKSKLDVLY